MPGVCTDGIVALPHQHQLEAIREFILTHPLRINLNTIAKRIIHYPFIGLRR